MAIIKVKWSVDELANVMTLFDVQRVYRSTTGKAGAYSEITTVGTRVALVVDQVEYYYDDTAGDDTYWYKIAYYHTTTLLASELSDAISAAGGGNYASVQDMRDEGVTETEASDARLITAIRLAESYVERTTGRWFYPRLLTLKFDGKRSEYLEVGPPIILLDNIRMLYEPVVGGFTFETIGVDSVRVYNRHLTQGLIDPDDREAPKVVFEDFDWQTVARWWVGNQNVVLDGYFGYTVLGPHDPVGETFFGSQVPLAHGSTPLEFSDVVKRLVVRWLPQRGDLDAVDDAARRGQISKIKTRDQEINYAVGGKSPSAALGGAFTGDPYIDPIIAMFKRPANIEAV
jgi:hypothetical protein